MNTGILLIEGLCGSGKSTTAQWLNLHFNRQGINATWFFEHDPEHPIIDDKQIQILRSQVNGGSAHSPESAKVFYDFLIRWEAFASEVSKNNSLMIVESAFFQASVGSLLMMGWRSKDILSYVVAMDKAVNPLGKICSSSPRLLYFDSGDVTADLQHTMDKRGSNFTQFLIEKISQSNWYANKKTTAAPNWSAVQDFFKEYHALISMSLPLLTFEVLSIKKHAADTNWSEINAQVCDWLSLPRLRDPFAQPIDPYRYIGGYQDLACGDKIFFEVNQTGLYIDDDFKSQMIHIEDNRFLISGMSIECEFLLSERRLTLKSNLPGLAKEWKKIT